MDKLLNQVRCARRRLVFEQFLSRLVWCLFGTLVIATVAIALPKVFVMQGLPAWWANAWLLGAAAAGVIAACVWTLIARRSALEAAMEIDRRFELRERVASSLSLGDADRDTEAGLALVSDAVRAIDRIDVRERFGIAVNRRAWLPLVPAAVAFCLATFVGNREANSNISPQQTQINAESVKKSIEEARKQIAELKKKAEEKENLKEIKNVLDKIEKGTKDLAKKDGLDQKEATVELNNLKKELEDRRAKLGSRKSLEKQFGNQDFGKGPGEKLADAMKSGDWQKAQDELNKLKEQLKKGNLDPAAQKQLGEQLAKMQQKLDEAAKNHQHAMDQLQKQIDQQRQQGNHQQAAKLQEKLDQMAQQQPQMQALQQMAQQMAQCQQCMQAGDKQGAQQALDQLAQQMQQMQMDAEQLEMLDQAMEQLQMAKQSMGCKQCQGAGCQACQGGFASAQSDKWNQRGGQNGPGIGKGSGPGTMPDKLDKTGFRDSQVRQNVQKGAMTFGGRVEGPNLAGSAAEQIKSEMSAETIEPADPLTRERLPRSRREHAKEYFDTLREGM